MSAPFPVGAENGSRKGYRLAPLHYVVRRSRSGRFNFTIITEEGRLTGSVSTEPSGRTRAEIEQEARGKIRAIAGNFAAAVGLKLAEEDASQAEEQGSEAPVASGELAT